MNVASTMGPVQVAALTYLICTVIALGVAGVIQVMFNIMQARKKRAAQATAAMVQGNTAAKA
jgi:hypothetical protein